MPHVGVGRLLILATSSCNSLFTHIIHLALHQNSIIVGRRANNAGPSAALLVSVAPLAAPSSVPPVPLRSAAAAIVNICQDFLSL